MWFVSSSQTLLSFAQSQLRLFARGIVCKLVWSHATFNLNNLALFAQLLFFAFYSKSSCGKNMRRYSVLDIFSKDALVKQMCHCQLIWNMVLIKHNALRVLCGMRMYSIILF